MYFPGTGPLYTPRTRKHILENFSPAGLHVLVVDDDPLCLTVLERMLKQCDYRVTICNKVSHALEMLREKEKEFDLVISDVYMPNEDGFKLLEVIGFELDLPVIMISANADLNVVMKGVLHGACDYLIKPVRIEELRNIWQHVIRRRVKDFSKAESWEECDLGETQASDIQEDVFRKRKEVLEVPEISVEDFSSSPKKARVNWSQQLHQQFVNAVNQLGVDKAVPKKILEIMNVQGLSRENVASHLQKYRLYIKRLSGIIPEPFPVASFQASEDGTSGGAMLIMPGRKGVESTASIKGLNLGAGLKPKSGRGIGLDSGTVTSLMQFQSNWQKHAVNRAQVLTAIGVQESPNDPSSSQTALVRMASLDLGFLSQAMSSPECSSPGATSAKVVEDLARFNINRNIKLEDDAVTPGPPLCGLSEQQCLLERPGGHCNTKESDKRQMRSLSLPVNVGDSVYFKDFAEAGSTFKTKTDVVISSGSQAGIAYGLASGLFVPSDAPAALAQSSSGKPNNFEYDNTRLQTTHAPIACLSKDKSFANANLSTKQTLSGCVATEMSEQTFSNSGFGALIEDFNILPQPHQHLTVQKANSEVVNVDQYLQFE